MVYPKNYYYINEFNEWKKKNVFMAKIMFVVFICLNEKEILGKYLINILKIFIGYLICKFIVGLYLIIYVLT